MQKVFSSLTEDTLKGFKTRPVSPFAAQLMAQFNSAIIAKSEAIAATPIAIYSLRRASMGLSPAARRAGKKPNTRPVSAAAAMAPPITAGSMATGQLAT